MTKTLKVMLMPNNKQITKLFKCAGTARFTYNWTLWYQQTNYYFGYSFVNDIVLDTTISATKYINNTNR